MTTIPKNKLKQFKSRKHDLRNGNELGLPNGFKLNNHFGQATFAYFFTKLTNNLFLKSLFLKLSFKLLFTLIKID